MPDLIAEAVKEGLWAEKKDKEGKAYYQNKADKRTKEKSMRAKDLEKHLQEHAKKDKGKDKKEDKEKKKKEEKKDDKKEKKDDKKEKKDDKKEKKDDKKEKKDDKKEKKDDKKEKKEKKEEKEDEPPAAAEADAAVAAPAAAPPEHYGIADTDAPPEWLDAPGVDPAEAALRQRLRDAYRRGWRDGAKRASVPGVGQLADDLPEPPRRQHVDAPVEPKEDWAPMQWPRWQALLIDTPQQPRPLTGPFGGVPQAQRLLRGTSLSPEERLTALAGRAPAHRTPDRDHDLVEHLPPRPEPAQWARRQHTPRVTPPHPAASPPVAAPQPAASPHFAAAVVSPPTAVGQWAYLDPVPRGAASAVGPGARRFSPPRNTRGAL